MYSRSIPQDLSFPKGGPLLRRIHPYSWEGRGVAVKKHVMTPDIDKRWRAIYEGSHDRGFWGSGPEEALMALEEDLTQKFEGLKALLQRA